MMQKMLQVLENFCFSSKSRNSALNLWTSQGNSIKISRLSEYSQMSNEVLREETMGTCNYTVCRKNSFIYSKIH